MLPTFLVIGSMRSGTSTQLPPEVQAWLLGEHATISRC
jgi:hypothetical protein